MSPNLMFLAGCAFGAVGLFGVLVLFIANERAVYRQAKQLRNDMEGR